MHSAAGWALVAERRLINIRAERGGACLTRARSSVSLAAPRRARNLLLDVAAGGLDCRASAPIVLGARRSGRNPRRAPQGAEPPRRAADDAFSQAAAPAGRRRREAARGAKKGAAPRRGAGRQPRQGAAAWQTSFYTGDIQADTTNWLSAPQGRGESRGGGTARRTRPTRPEPPRPPPPRRREHQPRQRHPVSPRRAAARRSPFFRGRRSRPEPRPSAIAGGGARPRGGVAHDAGDKPAQRAQSDGGATPARRIPFFAPLRRSAADGARAGCPKGRAATRAGGSRRGSPRQPSARAAERDRCTVAASAASTTT